MMRRRFLPRSTFLCALLLLFGLAAPALAGGGWLDLTFGGDGRVVTAFGADTFEEARDLAIQADGKIIAVGPANEIYNGSARQGFGLARYLADGSPDPTFDGDGRAITFLTMNRDSASAVALQQDGRIVVGGQGSIQYKSRFALARYNFDGSLDQTFGASGIVLTPFERDEALIKDLLIQADGRIVAAGRARTGNDSDVVVARYNPDGSLDSSFSGDGIEITQVGTVSTGGVSLEALPDGKLLVAATAYSSPYNAYLLRYLPDGALDPTFGQGGIAAQNLGGPVTVDDMALQRDGKILLVGMRPSGFGVTRVNADGQIDTSFGNAGAAIALALNGVTRVAQDRAGGVLVAGRYLVSTGSEYAVVRFDSNGALDSTFGENGVARAGWGYEENAVPWAMKVDANGKILLGGGTGSGTRSDFGVARFGAPQGRSTWLPVTLR